jgi:hypothetical protein
LRAINASGDEKTDVCSEARNRFRAVIISHPERCRSAFCSIIERNHTEEEMQDNTTIRELSAAELDQVGGGLSLGVGVNLDLSSELGAVSGVIDQVGGLVSGLVGGLLGAVGGVTG